MWLLLLAPALLPRSASVPAAPTSACSRRAILQTAAAASLLPLPACAISIDPDKYGDKELKLGTVNKLRQDVRNACGRDLSLLVPLLQLSIADALSYTASPRGGGIDGSILFEMDRASSAGLERAAATVRQVHKEMQRTNEISYADVTAFAGAAAIEAIGGPRINVQIGRDDVKAAEPEGARAGFSWGAPTLAGWRALGKDAGLTSRELVALVGALGTLELAARPRPASNDSDEEDDDGVDAAGRAAADEVGGADRDTIYGKVRQAGLAIEGPRTAR